MSTSTLVSAAASPSVCPTATSINWQPCTSFPIYATQAAALPQAECGYLTVPLDYFDCKAGNGELFVIRLNATNSPKMGSIFGNPGGPGDSGALSIFQYGPSLLQVGAGYYDLISWDPRGVGATQPAINCEATALQNQFLKENTVIFDGPQQYGNFTNKYNTDPDELLLLTQLLTADAQLKQMAEQCYKANGKNLTYVGSAAAARDMISISDVIQGKGQRLNYWGFSYGSLIGNFFINMFPDRVGRFVIDGIVNPLYYAAGPSYKLWPFDIQNVTEVFNEFTSSCALAGPKYCAIAQPNSTSASIAAYVESLVNLAYTSYGTPNNTAFRSSEARNAIYQGMYGPNLWPQAAQELALLGLELTGQLPPGTGFPSTVLKRSADSLTLSDGSIVPSFLSRTRQRRRRGSLSPFVSKPVVDTINSSDISWAMIAEAITCGDAQDSGFTTTATIFAEMIQSATSVSQMFAAQWDAGYWCHRWPVRAAERYAGPWNATLKYPVLVVSNTADNRTPLAAAEIVTDLLGPSAVLLRRDSFGHTSLGTNSVCTDTVIGEFFVLGRYPAANTVCSTDHNYFNVPTMSSNSSASSIVPLPPYPTVHP